MFVPRRLRCRDEETSILDEAANQLEQIRSLLAQRNLRAIAQLPSHFDFADSRSVVVDIATTVSRIPQVFAGMRSLHGIEPSDIDAGQRRPSVQGGRVQNPAMSSLTERDRAALSCYVIYSAIQWRGLGSSVSTCMITALTTVGSSRRTDAARSRRDPGRRRVRHALECSLLPHMDGMAEFTLLFVAVTGSVGLDYHLVTPISYAGAQTAFAFYVTHLRTFGPQTSLAIARRRRLRDSVRVGGHVDDLRSDLGEDTRGRPDPTSSSRTSGGSQLSTSTQPAVIFAVSIDKVRSERAVINANFDQIRNLSDSLIFEFGANWAAKRQLRDHVRRSQPLLRTYFLLQVALLHYRLEAEEGQLTSGCGGSA